MSAFLGFKSIGLVFGVPDDRSIQLVSQYSNVSKDRGSRHFQLFFQARDRDRLAFAQATADVKQARGLGHPGILDRGDAPS